MIWDRQDTTELFLRFRDDCDHEAFEVLYRQVEKLLRRFAGRTLQAGGLTEDILQATFLVACQRASSFDPDKASGGVVPWLRGIMKLIVYDAIRTHGKRLDPLRLTARQSADARSPEELLHEAEFFTAVAEALDRLPPPYRVALRMNLLLDLPPKEIARRLATSSSTVRTQLIRGLELLRARLRHHAPHPP